MCNSGHVANGSRWAKAVGEGFAKQVIRDLN